MSSYVKHSPTSASWILKCFDFVCLTGAVSTPCCKSPIGITHLYHTIQIYSYDACIRLHKFPESLHLVQYYIFYTIMYFVWVLKAMIISFHEEISLKSCWATHICPTVGCEATEKCQISLLDKENWHKSDYIGSLGESELYWCGIEPLLIYWRSTSRHLTEQMMSR